MIEKYFEDGFILKRFKKDNKTTWSDSSGSYDEVAKIEGYLRVLNYKEELNNKPTLKTTHRFYTRYSDIRYKDRIIKDGVCYEVKMIDFKKSINSNIKFYQIDLELI